MAQDGRPDSPSTTPVSSPTISASPSTGHSSTSVQTATDNKGSVVKGLIEKTSDRLGKNKSLLSQSQPALPQLSPKRMFGLTRGHGKERQTQAEDQPTSHSHQLTPSSPPHSPRKHRRFPGVPGDDESPFITPTSPSLGPSRPESLIFRGFRSMHAGTQTFIQALQAVPWTEDQDNDEDQVDHDATPGESESDDDDRIVNRLTSSIHAIYRPLARFRKGEASASSHRAARSPILPNLSDNEETLRPEDSLPSDEDTEGDFEPHDGHLITDLTHSGRISPETIPDLDASVPDVSRGTARSGSMATVRRNRRAQLAEKLRDVFELSNINEVVAEMPCWLLRSVLLQGYMYLTDAYICFFAHLPSREDQVLKSGSLFKKAQRTKRWIRHWFVLKNDVLSWYQSASDPYFPHGVVDLRYAISCEPLNEKDIRLRTNQKSIRLSADSVPNRDEWVKAIRRVMLKAQNMGDSIKIAIPYPTVVDVEMSSAMDFSETIEIKVQDKTTDLALDSYFFAYFQDLPTALEQIRDAVRTYRGVPFSQSSPTVVDTTSGRSSTARSPTSPSIEHAPKSPSGFRLASLLQTLPLGRSASASGVPEASNEGFTHIVKKSGSSFVPIVTTNETTSPMEGGPGSLRTSTSSLTPTLTPAIPDHTYPPSTGASIADVRGSIALGSSKEPSTGSSWSVGIPSMPSIPAWLRAPSRSLFGAASTSTASTDTFEKPTLEHAATISLPVAPCSPPAVTEIVSSRASSSSMPASASASGDFGFFSILETPETTVDGETIEKFRQAFAFDDKENLLGIFPGYLFRLLPVYGRLYVSNNYFCFKSSGPLTSRTRMILPLRDVLATEKQKSFRFGHHGLVVIVKGHEELFFEFVDEERRDAFISVLQRQMDDVRQRTTSSDTRTSSDGRHDALILEELGPRNPLHMSGSRSSSSDCAPAHMFTSQSSTFLSFKPEKPLHFTFLTIGSRGDVQPYIALAKGLLADGHRVRIATHGEFKEWVESHGIEFGYVGGDPAELMRICVENGTFTVAFLKEGVQKFRGWIDDLLKTSWEACQGTDVLIESPSAMGGYHIAEALKIPYFRAFTMTWSRTRAYPHAFAVPEHKMGGNYNYMTYVLFDQVFWRGTAGQINRWRRNTLGLPGTSLDKMEPHKIPFLYNFSPSIVPPPLDWPEWIRVTGYWFLDAADVSSKKWEPPQALLDFINEARKAQKKIVYIGFGSIVVPDPKAMTRCVIDAIVQSGVYAILSKGWSDRLVKNAPAQTEPEEPLPKQIYPVSSVPHDWLFKQIDAACHHGGAGTTGASLRAGIPTIIKPFFGDQFFWGDRVEALGIGASVRKLTVESLSHALHEATTNQKLIDRARVVGEQIRAENGVATAIEAIYRDLEYARSLIKGATQRNDEEYFDAEHATIRDYPASTIPPELPSPCLSASGAASDWSVIEEDDNPQDP